ncbi:hypothetical protein Tco_0439950 [Tanacetum coccineum]
MELENTQNNALAKLPMLKLGEYEMWEIRIKQYFQIQDYALWEVIENGNSWVPIPVTAPETGPSTATKMTVPSTAEEKICKKNDVKARSLLLMALPNEHQLTFDQYVDAQSMFAAIKARFGGNEATKKTQKAMLKQQYENFNASSSESLDSIFNRLQKLVSRLAILGVVTPPEDLNVKFLRSLPSEWDTHVVVWMNKPDFDTMGLDDLYNNFKIVEQKVKKSVGTNNDDKNLAFLTTSGASSTNIINTVNPINWDILPENAEHQGVKTTEIGIKKTPIRLLQNYKISDFKGMSYNEIRPIFEKVWDFNQHIEPMEHGSEKMKSPEKIEEEDVDTQKEMKEVSKESGAKRKKSLPRKSTRGTVKRQKMEVETEKEDLKGYLDIILREEFAEDVESISIKYPIVDWKTCDLTENFMYCQIFRGDGSSKNYKVLSEMLKDFDRLDVEELYRLVKERYSASRPEGYDLMLWGDLHTLFEPDEEDEIWKNQHKYSVISWSLHDFCGIHILLIHNGIAIHMLTEKKYPLSQEMITKMLNKRLEVDHESSQAFKLLRPTGKKFTLEKLNCGYQWRPTGKKFALGELCPLTKLSVVQIILRYLDSGCSKLDLEEGMAPVRISSGPEPIMMTPGRLNSFQNGRDRRLMGSSHAR